MEPTTTTAFRSVSPTLRINYDSRPIMEIVALVAAKAGFHVGAVVGILFDLCCITRTTMIRMNQVHCHSDGQPFSAPAYTRDVFDTAHILHFDRAAGERLTRTSRLLRHDGSAHASDSDTSMSDSPRTQPHDGDGSDDGSAADSDAPVPASRPDDGGNNDAGGATRNDAGGDEDRSSGGGRRDGGHGGDDDDGGDDGNDDDGSDDDDEDDDDEDDDGDDNDDNDIDSSDYRTLAIGEQIRVVIKRDTAIARDFRFYPEDRSVTVTYLWKKTKASYEQRLREDQLG